MATEALVMQARRRKRLRPQKPKTRPCLGCLWPCSSRQASKAAAEDAAWQETDKGTKAKAQRAADAAAKADAKLAAKAELKELEKQEEEANSQMKGANKKSGYPKAHGLAWTMTSM